jgi:stage II sporulation protein D
MALLALALIAGCAGGDPSSPDASVPTFDVDNALDPDTGDLVLYPSDAVYEGELDAPVARLMATDEASAMVSAMADQSVGPPIRIGVVQSSSSILLGSTADYTIRDKANGVLVMSGTNGTATVTLAAVPEVYVYLQTICSSVATVSARKTTAEALGYLTLTEVAPAGCTRLLIGRLPTSATAAQRNDFKNTLIGHGLAAADAFFRNITIGNQTVYRITRGTTVVQNLNPVVVTSSTGIITIGSSAPTLRRYRGKGEARVNSSALLAGISELPVEHYLYGVVPLELGPIQYPEVEAQRAQAVAARTYAMAGFGKRSSDGYDLRATTDDQVYGGYAFEHPVSNAAVDATAGIVATSGGKLISALFSSTSGGHTADNEEAFTGAPASYLRGIPDAERGKAFEHVPSLEVFRAHANSRSLRAAAEGDFESNWASFHRWSFEWTADEISSVISTFAGKPVGRVLEINVLERGPSGRVLRIEYVTEQGTFTHAKDAIRSSLKYINASGNPANLLSTLFFIEPVKPRGSESEGGFRVYGGGFGHGVGLSQTGAVGMAEKGHSFTEILMHYYRGITLESAY